MIKGVISTDQHLSIGHIEHVYFNMSTPSAGMMRYNGNSSCIEVYDGSYWKILNNFQDIKLSENTRKILEWASKKMEEESNIEQLAKTHPAIASALENFRRAEQQLETSIYLSTNYEPKTTG